MQEHKPLRELVYEELRMLIMTGQIKPGTRMMEIDLAESMGVSRTPVREAIRQLEKDNLVTIEPRRGAYVSDISAKDMEDMYRNLSTGGKEYQIKTGRTSFETKKIDPRCLVSWYRANMTANTWSAGEDSKREDFVGCQRGAQAPAISMGVINYSTTRTAPKSWGKQLRPDYFFSFERPSVWLGYAESLFLKAEAALRGWTGTGLTMGVEDYFKAGVKASMDYYGIDNADAQAYIDGLKVLADGTFASGDRERILEAIITQKWMAVFPNGNEGWAEYRRTDYPALYNQLTNASGGEVPQGKTIKRLDYALSENQNQYFLNHAELQQSNTEGTRLWWDVADTNDGEGHRVKPNNFR